MEDALKGKFFATLKRNYKQIRDDRALQIVETSQLKYKRTIEDIEMEIKDLERSRAGLLDLSPTNTQTLVVAADFDVDQFIQKDLDLCLRIRNSKIKLELAQAAYKELFENLENA